MDVYNAVSHPGREGMPRFTSFANKQQNMVKTESQMVMMMMMMMMVMSTEQADAGKIRESHKDFWATANLLLLIIIIISGCL